MDESDKKWLDVKFNNIEAHLKKTCSEIKDIDSKMSIMNDIIIRTGERLDNHLKSNEKQQLKIREWILITIASISTITAIVTGIIF